LYRSSSCPHPITANIFALDVYVSRRYEWLIKYVDPPLSGVGREQARLVGERFANIHVDNVAASQLLRARETAQYISQHHPNATFQVNEHAV
jgi:broad specificity phosphatase PhoE